MTLHLTPAGQGPETLFVLASRFRCGDQSAGWRFATSPQVEALITRQIRAYSRYSYVKEEDLEDLRQDLRIRAMAKLADLGFRLPDYSEPRLNEAALVSYFGLHFQELARQAMRTIIGPNVGKTNTRADADIEFSQLVRKERSNDFGDSVGDGPECPVEEDLLQYLDNPLDRMDATRRARVLAVARRFFQDDHEATIAYSALWHHAQGARHWGEVAEAIGVSASRSRYARTLALRFRNVMKAALILAGEDVNYEVLGVYTSDTEGGATLLSSSGASRSWSVAAETSRSFDAFHERVRRLVGAGGVTFAVLNLDDHSSPMRISAMKALAHRDPLVERLDIGWLEVRVTDALKGLSRMPDAKRRSLLLAHAKRAECGIRGSAA